MVADRWTLMAIDALEAGSLRFSQLQRALAGVSQKMLTQTLRQMERDGLVARKVYAEVPPRVEYTLTELGQTLGEAVCPLWLWAEKHAAAVLAARKGFDERSAGKPV
ncbi:helix-turn-helix domain-containing protein [Nostoc sp. NIES-2111]